MMRSKRSSRNLALPQLPVNRLKPSFQLPLLALGILLTLAGCVHKKEPLPNLSLSAAQKKFETKCREEYELQVITRVVGQTIYVYLPTDKPLFDYEAQKETPPSTEDSKKKKYTVQFADTSFASGRFALEYDIIDKIKSSKEDYGYSNSYTESYRKAQTNLYVAISDIFFDTKLKKDEIKPLFMVMIITDIKKGLETRATFYLDDLKRTMGNDLPSDEFYSNRILGEVKGGQAMIGDEIGTHILYKDITMPEFLTKQITNRINTKFTRSDFPPQPDFDKDIIAIVADTTRYYNFNEFQEVRLNNLRSGKKFIFTKDQLSSFGDDKPKDTADASKGKLIHIIFENGKAHFPGEKDEGKTDPSPAVNSASN